MSLALLLRKTLLSRSVRSITPIQNGILAQYSQCCNKISSSVQFKREPVKPFQPIVNNARLMSSGDHTTLWTIERAVSLTLVATVPLCVAFPNPIFDTITVVSVTMHAFWGFDAIILDYLRPSIVGEIVPMMARGLLVALTLAVLGGFFTFIYNDIGVGNAIRRLWNIGKGDVMDCKCST